MEASACLTSTFANPNWKDASRAYCGDMPAAIEMSHPPEALLRAVNPVLRVLIGVPGVGSALKDFMVVEFTGRKSGRHFSVPVSAHHLDGDLYAILEAGWKYNFADGAPAEVVHAGKKTPMQGQLIKDPATVADIAHRVANAYGAKKAQRSMGFKFTTGAVPSVAELTEAATRLKIAAIRLTPRA
jgi:hypothetical protein